MTLQRLGFLVRPGTLPEDLRAETGAESLPAEVAATIASVITEALPTVPDGSSAVLSHTRLPGGGALLLEMAGPGAPDDAATAGWPDPYDSSARRVTACYLPGGAEELGDRTPIETWRSRLWEPSGSAADGAEDAPDWCDDAHLVEFAAAHAEQVEPFLADVHRLFAAPAGRQIVIAERDPATVARWIALACASLTPACARALTFVLFTDRPAAAPQQLVGIGPDADFDRADEAVLRHLYRVYDGLGGPGSEPLPGPDNWASVAAQVWRTGLSPRTAYDRQGAADEPFGIGPLRDLILARPVDTEPYERGESRQAARPAPVETAPPPASRPAPVPPAPIVPPATVTGGGPDAGREDLEEAVSGIPGGANPVRVAAVRRGPLTPAELSDLFAKLGVRVPPSDDGLLAAVLAEFAPPTGEPADDAGLRAAVVDKLTETVRARHDTPFLQWVSVLEALHTLSPPRERPLAADRVTAAYLAERSSQEAAEVKAAAGICRDLLWQGAPRDEQTRAPFERLATPFVRLLLDQLAKAEKGPRPEALAGLVASPLGGWLDSVYEQAPARLRLIIEAERLRNRRIAGMELFRRLIASAGTEEVWEPALLGLVLWLVWQEGTPSLLDALELLSHCGPSRIAAARFDGRLARLLTVPEPPSDHSAELADQLLSMRTELDDRQAAVAKLLNLGRRMDRHEVGPKLAIQQVRSMLALSVPDPVRDWATKKLAVRLAESQPAELADTFVLGVLAGPLEETLLKHYVDAQLTPKRKERLVDALVGDPEGAAKLFTAWGRDSLQATIGWRNESQVLTTEVFGEAVVRLRLRNPIQLQKIGERLRAMGELEWAHNWEAFAGTGLSGTGIDPRNDFHR